MANPSPIVTLVNPVQSSKARRPMLVTLSGITIASNEEHLLNVQLSMVFKLFGRTTFVRLAHRLNALDPRLTTLSGITMLVKPIQ